MRYKLELGGWNSIFAVPTSVVDNYIKLASGNSVKVLLYFLRNSGSFVSSEEISRKTGVAQSDVDDALVFWQQTGLLAADGDLFIPDGQSQPQKNEAVPKVQPVPTIQPLPSVLSNEDKLLSLKKIELSREPRFNPKEIATTIRTSEGLDYLFKHCEKLFGRPLRHNEQNMLMLITEDIGLASECAVMLVDYCFSIDKPTPAYIKKLASVWIEKEINTVSRAEEEIRQMRIYSGIENELKRSFEINNAFSKMQKDYIKKWTGQFGLSVEMIDAAYQVTLNNTGKLSFQYMDKVITGWNEKGYKQPEDIEQGKRTQKPQNQQTTSSSFNLEDFYKGQLQKYN